MYKFEKNPFNISGTSPYSPLVNLGLFDQCSAIHLYRTFSPKFTIGAYREVPAILVQFIWNFWICCPSNDYEIMQNFISFGALVSKWEPKRWCLLAIPKGLYDPLIFSWYAHTECSLNIWVFPYTLAYTHLVNSWQFHIAIFSTLWVNILN